MEKRTVLTAEPGRQDYFITREFDLPLDLLFKAYTEPEIIEEWMGSKVLLLENKKFGAWRFQKKDRDGKVVFEANGVIHEFIPDKKIIRTFEIVNFPVGVQLELLEFEKLSDDTSKLKGQTIYQSNALRDQNLKMGLAHGLNLAHNRLQETLTKLK